MRRRILHLITITFVGCAVLVWACADQEYTLTGDDKDNDGWTSDVDCDDKDPDVHPGANELVNCRDDNCNNRTDENTSNEDTDRDGYCPSNGDIGDCEGNPMRNPGVPEDGGTGSQKPNKIDDNCNGVVDEGLPTSDIDEDGFMQKDDCNDGDPYVNPGAIEVAGMTCHKDEECPSGKCVEGYCRCEETTDCSSGKVCTADKECTFPGEECKDSKCVTTFSCHDPVAGMKEPTMKVCRDNTDNDCDGKVDELPTVCDGALDPADPFDYARAMELCDTDKTCGMDTACPGNLKCDDGKCTRVLSAQFNSQSNASQRTIAADFAQQGPYHPHKGQNFVILSTGQASYVPAQLCPQQGTDYMFSGTDPDTAAADRVANDIIELELEIAVPTNARSFEFDFHFFSTEYPEFLDTQYNDTFWVELTSKKLNGNISFDKNNVPIRINNAFFSICDPYPSKPKTQSMCQQPASVNTGTGYATDCNDGFGSSEATGGSTDWLRTRAPVTPGETIKLRFMIFDKGDGILDSAVLIDNFRWNLSPASKPVTSPD